jgi:long-chain fatty acid transport protein
LGGLVPVWKDTYHVGLGMFYELGENHHLSAGVAYDTSPVDDKDRTIDLPLDEQLKFSFGYAKAGRGNWRHAISASAMWFGDGEVDQIAQGARFKGEFDTNWIFIIMCTFIRKNFVSALMIEVYSLLNY